LGEKINKCLENIDKSLMKDADVLAMIASIGKKIITKGSS